MLSFSILQPTKYWQLKSESSLMQPSGSLNSPETVQEVDAVAMVVLVISG